MSSEPNTILKYWDNQIERLQSLVEEAQPTQDKWNALIPKEIKGAQKKFKAVAFHQLLSNLSLGGDRWISQFVYGFPTTGVLSQGDTFPPSEMPNGTGPYLHNLEDERQKI